MQEFSTVIPIPPTLRRCHGLSLFILILVVIRWRRRDRALDGGGTARDAGVEDGAGGEEEVELGVPHLEEVLGVELDGGGPGDVVHALDEAAVLAKHLEREPAAREVVEDARVAAGDVHASTEGAEVHVDAVIGLRRRGGGALAAAAAMATEDDGVGLHVVLEAFALQLRESYLPVRRRRRVGGWAPHVPHVWPRRGLGFGPFDSD